MEEEKKKGRQALERNLQKAFKVIQSVGDAVQSTSRETLPHVQTLANLLGQYESCASVDPGTLPFISDFPDFMARLLLKISEEISHKVTQMETMLEVLKEKQEATSKHCETSWSLVQKYSSALDMATLCADSPHCSLADMLEQLEALDTLLYQQYWSKIELLEMVMAKEEPLSESLVHRWTDEDDVLVDAIKEFLAKAEMFVTEKK